MPRPCPEISDDSNYDTDNYDMSISRRGCCFWIPCYGSVRPSSAGSIWWERIRTVDSQATRGWKKARELSKLIASPKWKAFIRKFRKNRSSSPAVICIGCLGGGNGGVGCCGRSRQKNFHFQYDPISYALNFDNGPGQKDLYSDEDLVARNFSSRLAAVPACPNCSAKIGKDAPLIM